MIERTQELSEKQIIKIRIDKALARSSSMEEFVLNLEDLGIKAGFNTSKSGYISGVSFSMDGFSVKGSKLGSKYSYANLRRRLPSIDKISQMNEKKHGPRTRTGRTR